MSAGPETLTQPQRQPTIEKLRLVLHLLGSSELDWRKRISLPSIVILFSVGTAATVGAHSSSFGCYS